MTSINLVLILIMSSIMYLYFYIVGGAVLSLLKQEFCRYFAPLVGYAIFSCIFFGLFWLTTNFGVVLFVFLLLPVGALCLFKVKKIPFPSFPYLSLFLSLLVGLYTLVILYPKFFNGWYAFLPPLSDHVKAAFTSSIAQTGIPVINPFCAFPEKSYYYFLYYVPLAALKIIFHATAYEAELSGEMLTCVIGLPFIVGCVCLLKKRECSWREIVLCFLFILMTRRLDEVLRARDNGIDNIIHTILWTPNTFLASSYLIFSLFWIHTKKFLHMYIPALFLVVVLGLSPYVFLTAFLGLGLFYLYDFYLSSQKKQLLMKMVKFISLIFLFSLPFLAIQMGANTTHGFPIELDIYHWAEADGGQRLIGFWTIFLFSQMPLIFLINIKFLKISVLKKYSIFYFSVFASLVIMCCLRSTIANNDLPWRASFVALELLTIFAVYYLGYIESRFVKTITILTTFCFIALQYDVNPYLNIEQKSGYNEPLSQETIMAMQKYVKENDYFLNNKDRELKMYNSWWGDANLEFAIITERRSCFMGVQPARAYCSHTLLDFIPIIDRIFKGSVLREDIETARGFKCNKFIFHKYDKNYDKDELLSSVGLNKIYENEQIKIWE